MLSGLTASVIQRSIKIINNLPTQLTSSSAYVPGTINTIVGDGLTGPISVSSVLPAITAPIGTVRGVAVDSNGEILSSTSNNQIYFVSTSNCSSSCPYGLTSTTTNDLYVIGGDGTECSGGSSCGNAVLATQAEFGYPVAVTLDSLGDVIVADYHSNELRLIVNSSCSSNCPYGLSSMIAGYVYTLLNGYHHWDCYGNFANLNFDGVAVDGKGNIYFGDAWTDSIYKLPSTGGVTFNLVAGQGGPCQNQGYSGDGGPATSALLNLGYFSIGLSIDQNSNLLITDVSNNRIRLVAGSTCSSNCAYGLSSTVSGYIYTIAGNGTGCNSTDSVLCGDGGLPVNVEINAPDGIAIDAAGQVFVSDRGDNRIWKFSPTGKLIQTVANATGLSGFFGDGGQAEQAGLYGESNIALDTTGNPYIADTNNNRIREIYNVGIPGPLTSGTGPVGTDTYGSTPYCSGDPVNCATGNYYLNSTDISIPFRDLPLEVTRTYNSEGAINCSESDPGPMGCGWSTNLGETITFSSSVPQTARVVQASGQTAVFTCSNNNPDCSSGYYTSPSWQFDTLTQNGSSFDFQVQGNLTYIFSDLNSSQTLGNAESSGVLTDIKDLNGYLESFNYCTSSTGCSANGNNYDEYQLMNLVDPASRNLWISYISGTNLISSVTDPAGRIVQYSYDSNDNLTQVSLLPGPNFPNDPTRVWKYSYGTDHLMLSKTDPNSNVTDISYSPPSSNIDSTNHLTSISCVSKSFCVAVDGIGNALVFNGNTWSTNLIDSNQSLSSTSCINSTFCVAVDGATPANAFIYNGSNWIKDSGIDGHPLDSISCIGSTSTFCVAVDNNGNYITYNGSSWSTATNIDSSNSLESVSCISSSFCAAVDNGGNALTFNGTSWSTPSSIDGTNQLNSLSCTDLPSTYCLVVDSKGNAITYNGTSWSSPFSIDASRNLTSVSCLSSSFCLAVDSNGNVISDINAGLETPFNIDGTTSLSSISCGQLNYCYSVDTSGNLVNIFTSGQTLSTTQVCASSDTSCNSLPNPNRTMSYSYDSFTAQTGSTTYTVSTTVIKDPMGNVTVENFIQNTMISETDGLGSSTPRTTYYSYTNSGSGSSTTLKPLTITDPDGHETTYQYGGPYGEVTSETNALGQTSTWTWNNQGKMTSYEPPQTSSETYPVVTFYNYDPNGNLDCKVTITNELNPVDPTCSSIPTNPSVLEPATLYTYGNGTINPSGSVGAKGTNGGWPGDVVSQTSVNYSGDPLNTINYTYDQYGDLLSKSAVVNSSKSDTTSYAYNTATGTLTCSVSPNGYPTINTSNLCSSPNDLTLYSYNDLNQLLGTLNPTGGLTLNSYDAGGRLISTQIDPDAKGLTPDDTTSADSDTDQSTVGPEGTTTYTYNSFNEKISSTTPPVPVNGGTPTPQTTSYTYNADGNLTKVTDPDGHVTTYTYDSLNRLSTMTLINGVTSTYNYDPAGNVLSAEYSTGISNFYSYNQVNELTAETLGGIANVSNITNSSCNTYIPFYDMYSIYCGAIGTTISGQPTIVLGDIGSWQNENLPSGITSLSTIACPQKGYCIAFGQKGSSVLGLETQNGANWSDISANLPTGTTQVSQVGCVLGSTDCYLSAVVSGTNEILYTSNLGSSFSQVAGAPSWAPSSITCSSSSYCYFAGSTSNSGQIEQFDISNSSWSAATLPAGVQSINSISCLADQECVASGTTSTGPTILTTYPTANLVFSSLSLPSNYTSIRQISCATNPGSSNCYSLGSSTNGIAIANISFDSSTDTYSIQDESTGIAYGTKSLSTIGCGYTTDCVAMGQAISNGGQIITTSNSAVNWENQFTTNLFSYDADNHETTMQDGIGTTGQVTYNYNPLGEMTSETNEYNVTTNYSYDLVGNMISITYPGSNTVTRTFDGANELTSVTTWLPGPGTCGTYNITSDTTTFSYDSNGNLTSSTLPDCDSKNSPVGPDVIKKSYDQNNKLTDIYGTFSGANDSVVYQNNGLGLITSRTVNSGTPTSYSYDALGQVTSVSNPNETFQYDNAGNLTCNQSGQYQTYNSLGEINYAYQTCGSTSNQQDSFSYDAYGDRIQEVFPWENGTASEDYSYTFNLGLLTGFAVFFTGTSYTYSGNGELMNEVQGSSVLGQFTWNNAASRLQMLSNGTWDFIYGPDNLIFEAINTSTSPSSPYYLFLDQNGTPLANFSQNGTINDVNLYNTWGAAISSGAPPIGFDNAYEDTASGLYYLDNRFYDPTTGQFLTIDTRLLAAGTPWSYAGVINPGIGGQVNLGPNQIDPSEPYQFVKDDKVNIVDPTGLCRDGCGAIAELGQNLSDVAFNFTLLSLLAYAVPVVGPLLGQSLTLSSSIIAIAAANTEFISGNFAGGILDISGATLGGSDVADNFFTGVSLASSALGGPCPS